MVNNVRQKINIVLVEYINRNLGDTVIAECARYFLEEALARAGIADYYIHEYNMYAEDMVLIRYADLIVFDGGGVIKYKRERFWQFVPRIIEEAEKYDIPVYFNCAGVEGWDEADEKCLCLKRAVNKACVKGITVRDDFDTFLQYYIEDEKEWLGKVLDSAAFSSEVYGCRKKPEAAKLGLGVSHERLFMDYGAASVTKQFLLDFWKAVIDRLKQSGYEWEIFTNGLYDEYEFALEILEYADIRETERYLARRPAEGRELAQTISGYRGIIAVRMHANIIAFSAGVPSVALVWNNKMLHWGESIGYPERFIEAEKLEAGHVLERLYDAMEKGCRTCTSAEREQIVTPLTQFVKKYGRHLSGRASFLPKGKQWEDILVANALGGKHFQYCGMNSSETIMEKYRDGFSWFEADVKLTTDGKLVCVNGWTQSTCRKLGLQNTENADFDFTAQGICYQKFMELAYYDGHYAVMDYEMLMDYLKRMEKSKLILDARNQTYSDMQKIMKIIQESIQEEPSFRQRLYIRIMSKVEMAAAKALDFKLMYDIPTEEEKKLLEMDGLEIDEICREDAVEYVSIRRQLCSPQLIRQIKKYNKKICLFTYNSVSEIEDILKLGADLIATDYLSVDGLRHLIQ